MTTIQMRDVNGQIIHFGGEGPGTELDPFIPTNGSVASASLDETNVRAPMLENGGSVDQNVNGSVTPVSFSYTPPAGYDFLVTRIIFYMEGPTAFDSNKFGSLAALANGWEIKINGVSAMQAKTNRELATYLFSMTGVEIFGKLDKTMIGRFTFTQFDEKERGIRIRDGLAFETVVNDDLTGLTYLEARLGGKLVLAGT